MPTKLQKFKSEVFSPGRLRTLALFATAVNILLISVFAFANPMAPFWDLVKGVSFHSYAISFSTHAAVSFHMVFAGNMKKLFRFVSLLFAVDFGVCIGYVIATLLHFMCFQGEFHEENLFRGLVFSFVVSTIFVIAFYIYEFQRVRLQRAVVRIKEQEINEHLLKKLKAQAELSALQAKINPHFLFNTLNSIASLIAVNPEKAEEAVEKLSNLFRATLRTSIEQRVTLEESIALVESYLELEKLRLGKRLEYEISMDPGAKDITVQDLLIQPLVENSIKHGLAPLVEGGKISVRVKLKEEFVVIQVEDNGVGWENKPTDSGHGLVNIRQRLELAYEDNYQLNIYKTNGVTVEVILPRRNL